MRILTVILSCLALARLAAAGVIPVIANPGFEEGSAGWGWYSRAKCTYAVSKENPYSGRQCIVFHNESPLEPEVYGRLFQVIGVLPATEYELSVWVRGKNVSSAIHFTDWNSYTLNIPTGSYDWQKISTRFRTKNDQNSLNIGINVVNLCDELAIDDISLKPIGSPLETKGINGWFLAPGTVIGDNAPASVAIFLNSTRKSTATVEATIRAGSEIIFKKSAQVKPGENSFEWEWNSGKAPVRQLECTITISDEKGKVVAGTKKIEKLGSAISADLDKVEAKLKDFDALYKKCKMKGIPLDYPRVTRTMVEQFLPLARMDLQKGEITRANWAVGDFNRSLDNAMAEMQAYLKNPKLAPNAVRYRTSKVEIKGLSFIGDRQDSSGKKSRGPVFFCGYGHFGQVRTDMPRWPGYGVNIIQIEIGPSAVFPSENEVNLKPAQDIVNVLDQAAKNNVMVNILLSPHYFPGWAYQKWPHLMKGGGGFFGYCVDAPEAKQIIEKFLRTVVPLFKDKPALHSFCLSNEPIFDRAAGCDNTPAMWAEYLAKVHGDIATLNARYKTQFSSFSEVPIPANDQYDAPQFYDYVVFNQERFANWHKWKADVIHEMAPKVPVHAKIMDSALLSRYTIAWGVDPELFGELSQINGNDNYAFPSGETIAWGSMNIGYDLQRSLNKKPIFNSENHISPDRSNYYIKPENFRTALWQGAIHGQGATTIWVWEKTYDKGSDFYGNVMDRPGCAEAVGRTCLDLNRFAAEVTALQNVKAPVAILWSNTSIARNQQYLDAMSRAYTALNFCGIKIDFISEKQLAAGKGSDYQIIMLPNATHLPEASFKSLLKLPPSSQCVIFGNPPSKDPWGNDFPDNEVAQLSKQAVIIPLDASTDKELWPKLLSLLDNMNLLPEIRVVDASTNQPVWGVEWLPAKIGSRTVINMVNLLEKPVDVRIVSSGRQTTEDKPMSPRILQARDLLSLGGQAKVRTLKPVTPVLAEVGQ
ncbi:MAG: beta-galactosidase [Armatimonadota bacterium]|nr:beta-galactosidase [Armatimonadota bacterium]